MPNPKEKAHQLVDDVMANQPYPYVLIVTESLDTTKEKTPMFIVADYKSNPVFKSRLLNCLKDLVRKLEDET